MTVEVFATTLDPTPTAVVKAATTSSEWPNLWGPLLGEVWRYLRGGDAPEGLWTHGHNVMLYWDDVPNVEVGVQVNGSFERFGSVVPSTLPGGLVAATTHKATVGEIGETHRAVREWSEANGYGLTGVKWEVYGDPDSAGHFDVDVVWQLKQA